jgi:DNA-binding PadR family transcriptional regulator
MVKTQDHRRHLPLAPHSFQILLSLLDGDRHGYSIIKDIEERSSGKIFLGTSTVYAAIKRMLQDGLLAESAGPAVSASSGPKRRYYQITGFGRTVARAEGIRISELNEMVAGSSLVSGARSPASGEVSS